MDSAKAGSLRRIALAVSLLLLAACAKRLASTDLRAMVRVRLTSADGGLSERSISTEHDHRLEDLGQLFSGATGNFVVVTTLSEAGEAMTKETKGRLVQGSVE